MLIRISLSLLPILCLCQIALAKEPAPGLATTPHARQSVDRAIGYLQTQGIGWVKTRSCAACHQVSMSLWALSEASRRGYTVDEKFLTDTTEAALESREKMMASGLLANPAAPPDPRPMARGVNMGMPFIAVAAESLPSLDEGERQSLGLIVEDIVRKQQKDGSWEFFLSRPPINESQSTDAAWILLAMMGASGPDTPQSQRDALARGIAWLESTQLPETYQDRALKTLIMIRAGKPRDEVQAAARRLLSLQQLDGGWGQMAGAKSDAFATGEALYVLAEAGWQTDDPTVQRAIAFLVSTQKPDGSWPMTSRATPDGRPGSAKLLTPINTGAGAWAVLGLARCVPNASHE